jgi:type IV pilus assembly protein PilC
MAMQFAYKGKTRDGRKVQGTIASASRKKAMSQLQNRGIKPYQVTQMRNSGPGAGQGGFIYRDDKGAIQIRLSQDLPGPKELAVFTKQLSLMIENGVPLLQALNLLKEQQKRPSFNKVLNNIISSIEKGNSLSDALEPYPQIFDSLYIAMIKTGEASGKLDLVLQQIVLYIEKSIKIRGQVRSALAYPTLIVVVSIAVISLLLLFVVPAFAGQFTESGQELPPLTQLVVNLSDLLIEYWMIIFGGGFASLMMLRSWIKTKKGRYLFDRYILNFPIFGELLQKIAISRFCSTLSTMLSSGVAILEALTICASSVGNSLIQNAVLKVRDEIAKGQNFHEPLFQTGLFPKMVCSMIAVGESTGTLDATLGKITLIYDDEVDRSVKTMTSMIEPLMIVVIGSIIGFIAIAMYLPIFDIASTVVE